MRWNTIEGPIDQGPDPLDQMSDGELLDLLDEIQDPLIEAWPDGTLVFEVPEAFEDPFDLEHQVIEKLNEREFQPEADLIADRVSENLRGELRKLKPEKQDVIPKIYGPK